MAFFVRPFLAHEGLPVRLRQIQTYPFPRRQVRTLWRRGHPAAVRRERMATSSWRAGRAHLVYPPRAELSGVALGCLPAEYGPGTLFCAICDYRSGRRSPAQGTAPPGRRGASRKARLERYTRERIAEIELRLQEAHDSLQQRRRRQEEELESKEATLIDAVTNEVRSIQARVEQSMATKRLRRWCSVSRTRRSSRRPDSERAHLSRSQELAAVRLDEIKARCAARSKISPCSFPQRATN